MKNKKVLDMQAALGITPRGDYTSDYQHAKAVLAAFNHYQSQDSTERDTGIEIVEYGSSSYEGVNAPERPYPSTMELNLDEPFEYALSRMVLTHRAKSADYAADKDGEFGNFVLTADGMGIEGFNPAAAIEFNIRQKMARLSALRKNGRGPFNETVQDTYLDLAVYSALLLTWNQIVMDQA